MPFLMGIVFIVICSLMLIWAVSIILSSLKTSNWPTASGNIIRTSIEFEKGTKKPGSDAPGTWDSYYPKIEYQYSVSGNEYRSSKVEAIFSGKASCNTEWQAKKIIEKYPEGRNVLVFYDPKDPSRACLESGIPWRLVFPIILFSFVGIGMGFYLALFRS